VLTVQLAYRNVFGNHRVFFALATIPLVVTAIILLVSALLSTDSAEGPSTLIAGFVFPVIGMLVVLLLVSVFVVAWCRFVVMGRRESTRRFQLTVGRREFRFVWASLKMGLGFFVLCAIILALIAGPAEPTDGSPPLATTLASLALLIVFTALAVRVSLRIPAMAVDQDQGPLGAWRLSHGSAWRLFLALLLTSFPTALVFTLVVQAQPSSFATAITLLSSVLIVFYLHSALIVSVLALVYRWLTPEKSEFEQPFG
jgi:hypothetical protein